MTHSQVPNPTQAAGAGTVPPLGGMNLIPPAQSSDQATQLKAIPKGMSKGQPIVGANGQFRVPIYNAQQQIDRYETLDGTPIPALPTSTSGLKTELKDDGQGHMVPVQTPTSSTTRKVVPVRSRRCLRSRSRRVRRPRPLLRCPPRTAAFLW